MDGCRGEGAGKGRTFVEVIFLAACCVTGACSAAADGVLLLRVHGCGGGEFLELDIVGDGLDCRWKIVIDEVRGRR